MTPPAARRRRGRVVAIGLLAAAAYVVGARVSGGLDPRARMPLLDGLAPPAPYRWVSPPPALASRNRTPQSLTATTRIGPKGVSAQVYTTADIQANLVLSNGAIPPSPGARSVRVSVVALDPARVGGRLPHGARIAGNVYRMSAVYEPGNARIATLEAASEVVLSYPQLTGPYGRYALLALRHDTRWRRVSSSIQNAAARNVTADVRRLGLFAVGLVNATPSASPGAPPATGSTALMWVIVALAALTLVVLVVLRVRAPRPNGRHAGSR